MKNAEIALNKGLLMKDAGKDLDFEFNALPYKLAAPAMWLMARWCQMKHAFRSVCHMGEPATNNFFFDGISGDCRAIKDGAASWKALEVIYNFERNGNPVSNWWINMRNAQAVRNRSKIIHRELVQSMLAIAKEKAGQPVHVVSLACGSAEGVIRAAATVKERGFDVKLTLIDWDGSAEEYIRRTAFRHGLAAEVEFQQRNLHKFVSTSGVDKLKPDIVEMLGFLDYLKDETSMHYIRCIYDALPKHGFFFTCHIHPNQEQDFLYNVVNWGRIKPFIMLYRSISQLKSLVEMAWLHEVTPRRTVDRAAWSEVTLITEPHGIHSVARAMK